MPIPARGVIRQPDGEAAYGVDSLARTLHGRTSGDRLGAWAEVFRWVHPVLAELATVVAIGFSFLLLSFSLKAVPFGTAYAMWTGIGAAGTMVLGMVMFGEPTDAFRVACLVLIIAGMVGLKLASQS